MSQEQLDLLAGQVAKAREVIRGLMRGTCWCEAGIGNPMMGGSHSGRCTQAKAFMEETRPK